MFNFLNLFSVDNVHVLKFAVASNQPSPQSYYDGDIMQLRHVDKVDVSTPQYQTMLNEREVQHARESNDDSEYTIYGKTSTAKNFHGFSLNGESFPMNYGLVNQQYKSTAKVLL